MKTIFAKAFSFAAAIVAAVTMTTVQARAAASLFSGINVSPGPSTIAGTLTLSANTTISGTNTINGTLSMVGGTLSLSSGTVTGSAGIIPVSLVSGAGGGSVTGMTLTLGGALTGSLTNTASIPALTLTLSSFPAASISGTITNGQLITPTISVGGTTITLGTGVTTLNSLSLSSLTVSGAITFSGVTTPVASTSYVLQINTVSGAISTTTASAGGGGGGSVTQVTGTTGRVTVTSTTSTPVVTLPTTLSISDTTLYAGLFTGSGSISITGSIGSPLFQTTASFSSLGGALWPQLNSGIGQDLATQIGTLSIANPFAGVGTGYAVGGGLIDYGPAYFPGGSNVGPLQVFSAVNVKSQNVSTTTTSSGMITIIGDSVGANGIGTVATDLIAAYGYRGAGQIFFNTNEDPSNVQTYSGGVIQTVKGTGETWTYSPNGMWAQTQSVGDIIRWSGAATPPAANNIVVIYDKEFEEGTFKIQTSSVSTGWTDSSSVVWTDVPGFTSVNSSISSGINLGTASFATTMGQNYVRIVQLAGRTTFLMPDYNVIGDSRSGWQYRQVTRGGTSLVDFNTTNANVVTGLLSLWNPDIISIQYLDGVDTWWNSLASFSSTVGSFSSKVMLIGPNPISNNGSQKVNAIGSSFAQQAGWKNFDTFAYALNYPTISSAGGMAGVTHANGYFSRGMANIIEKQMGFDFGKANLAANVSGEYAVLSSITFSNRFGQEAASGGLPLSSYTGGYLAVTQGNTPSANTMAQGFINNFQLKAIDTGSTMFTVTNTGAIAFGSSGADVRIVAPHQTGNGQFIRLDQPGDTLGDSKPAISVADGNNDTYGFVMSRGLAADGYLTSWNGIATPGTITLRLANASGTPSSVLALTATLSTFSSGLSALSASFTTITGTTISLSAGANYMPSVTLSGANTGLVMSNAGASNFIMVDTTGTSDARVFDWFSSGATLSLRILNDGFGVVKRTPWTVDGATGNTTFSAGFTTASLSVTNTSSFTGTLSGSSASFTTLTVSSVSTSGAINGATLSISGASTLSTVTATTVTLGAASVTSLSNSGTLSVSGASTIGTLTATTTTLGATTVSALTNIGTSTLGNIIVGSTIFIGQASNTITFSDSSHYVRVTAGVLELAGSSNGVQINSGPFTVSQTLAVTQTASLASLSSTTTTHGATTVTSLSNSGTLSVSGASTLSSLVLSSLSNSGTQSVSGAVTYGSTVVVGGAATYSSAVSISGNLAAGGPVSWGAGITITTASTQMSSTSHHIIVANSASALTFTLSPVAEAGREYIFINKNAGAVSISSSSGQATTIKTAAGALQSSFSSVVSNSSGLRLISDGTWWQTAP